MSITGMIIKAAAPIPQIENFNRYLFIGPHPDDIEIGAGATAAKLAGEGKEVCFLICTDGRFGDGELKAQNPEITWQETAAIRKKESIASARYLGVGDVRFLELSDGGFYPFEELLQKIAEVVSDFAPDIIFAPDPCVASESHVDHLNTGKAARQIAYLAPYPGIMKEYGVKEAPVKAIAYYMTARPNRFVATGGFLQKQLNSLKKYHKSQYPAGNTEFASIELYLKLRSLEYGLKHGHRCAEGFRVLGQTQMHCLPEAGE